MARPPKGIAGTAGDEGPRPLEQHGWFEGQESCTIEVDAEVDDLCLVLDGR